MTESPTQAPQTRTEQVFNEVMMARTRVYQLAAPTPMELYSMPGDWQMLLKREDLSPIHAYKWRGAYNFLNARALEARRKDVVAASAGNHAQGVALSAARLGIKAHLFMPMSAPQLKVEAVTRLGGKWVTIHQCGDSFDQAAQAAHEFCKTNECLYVPPFDDLLIMAGQGVLGDEMMTSPERPDVVFLQIGGGGMAAGVAAVIKTYAPDVKVIGVEEEGQASMKAALTVGEPVTLDHVDVFCDGTAVKRAGDMTFRILNDLLDDLVTVSVTDVASAIQELWKVARVLPEPSGALGFAAAKKYEPKLKGLNAGVVITGANVDFRQLSIISQRAGAGLNSRPYYQVKLEERPGTMIKFLKVISDLGINISYLTCGQNDLEYAFPVIGFDVSAQELQKVKNGLTQAGYEFKDVSSRPDISFRLAPFQPRLFNLPFAAIYDFPERPGAITEFLEWSSPLSTISYINYVHSGEQIGRVLLVLSFETETYRQKFLAMLNEKGPHHSPLSPETIEALGIRDFY